MRQCGPDPVSRTKILQILQQSPVGVLSSFSNYVVRMYDNADQSTTLQDELALLFPQINGVCIEDIKEGIILCDCDRNFQDIVDKVGKERATSPSLWVEMPDVGNRHVIGKIKSIVPMKIPVQNPRAETRCLIVLCVLVDLSRAQQKLFALSKQVS